MFSLAVSSSSRLGSWKTMPKVRRTPVWSQAGSWPSNSTWPACWFQKCGEHLDGGGFAGPVGAEETEDTAPSHGEGNIVHGGEIAVLLGEVFNLNDGVFHGGLFNTNKAPGQGGTQRDRGGTFFRAGGGFFFVFRVISRKKDGANFICLIDAALVPICYRGRNICQHSQICRSSIYKY